MEMIMNRILLLSLFLTPMVNAETDIHTTATYYPEVNDSEYIKQIQTGAQRVVQKINNKKTSREIYDSTVKMLKEMIGTYTSKNNTQGLTAEEFQAFTITEEKLAYLQAQLKANLKKWYLHGLYPYDTINFE